MSSDSASTPGWGSIIGTTLGGAISAFGAISGGEAQKSMYDYQAGIAKLNAQIAQQNATYALNVGELQSMQAGLQGGQRMGQIKAAQSASGLDVNSGSAKDVRVSQAQITGQDTAAIRANAARTAYNYQIQGVQYTAQANLDTMAGKNAMTAGFINAASSVVSTASAVSSEWMRGQQLGMWGSPGGSSGGMGGSSDQSFGTDNRTFG